MEICKSLRNMHEINLLKMMFNIYNSTLQDKNPREFGLTSIKKDKV